MVFCGKVRKIEIMATDEFRVSMGVLSGIGGARFDFCSDFFITKMNYFSKCEVSCFAQCIWRYRTIHKQFEENCVRLK